MIVQLTDISQGVSMDGRGEAVNRLHFKTDAGKTFSIQVSSEAINEVLQAVYEDLGEEKVASEESQEEPVVEPPEVEEEAATSFGDDDEGGEEETVEEQELRHRKELRQMRAERMAAPEAPQSEEDVPSL